ncbi:hypothetical protein quinque_000237 [Culex quinquefasciatus]
MARRLRPPEFARNTSRNRIIPKAVMEFQRGNCCSQRPFRHKIWTLEPTRITHPPQKFLDQPRRFLPNYKNSKKSSSKTPTRPDPATVGQPRQAGLHALQRDPSGDRLRNARQSCVGGKLKPFQCGTCQSCYETIKELRLHKCDPHQEPDDKAERREQLELLTQAIAGRQYDSDSDEMDVVGEEEVQPNKRCAECDRLIPVSRMQVHYRKFHGDCANAPFRCRLCKSQFGFCEDLSKHLRSHTVKQLRSLRNRKPDGIPFDSDGKTCYECYLCGNVFGTEEAVRLHQGTHLGDNIRCPVCGRNCESKSDFLKHLVSHQ